MRAVVLVTGDEVLEGRIGDRNGRFLSQELFAAGATLDTVQFIGDDVHVIRDAVLAAGAAGADLVITTGGLGPTHDDLTMRAVAEAAGVPLVVDPALAALVRSRCERHPRWAGISPDVQEHTVRRQAALPRGARVLDPVGTAPGAVVAHGDAVVVVLPGPPSECAPMWRAAAAAEPVAALLRRAGGGGVRVVRVADLIEAQFMEYLATLPGDALDGVRMGVCARAGELEVTLRQGRGTGVADAFAARMVERYGDDVISADGRDIDTVLADALRARGATVAVAESCTGGLLGARLTARPGSSRYVRGGVIAYDNAVKTGLLGVPADVIDRVGAVSAECARAMAEGVRRACGATHGVSVTGIAGPGGGTAAKPVGTVFVGVADPAGTAVHEMHLAGERDTVRERAVARALLALRRSLVAP